MPKVSRCCWWILATIACCHVLSVAAQAAGGPPFDGQTLQGWTKVDGKPITRGWEVVDGMIHLKPGLFSGGNIVTEQLYGDFDLTFEWKIAPGGNSGLKYRVRDYDGRTLGCEYQILDDERHSDALKPNRRAGSLYDLYEPDETKFLKPPGEFNLARIVVRCNRIQHWLNGRLILSATVGSQDWKTRLARSKFSEHEDFSQNLWGKLMLTDHGAEVWYRNFEISEFPACSPTPQRCMRPHRPIRNWIRRLRCRG